MEDRNNRKTYGTGICVLCALLGMGGLFALIYGIMAYLQSDPVMHWMQLLLIGYFSIIMMIVAYTGKAPKWAGDQAVFGSRKSEDDEAL
ncbi:hypothetical protein [Marinicella meishanensis]|uniref:hypothetical protein n=1 Tax=Marinicella meishanensis TaxID=2873263 RepID=UPI001CBDB051|nr:hypothetical protein [Marinicella sp. NBU2979]